MAVMRFPVPQFFVILGFSCAMLSVAQVNFARMQVTIF